MARVQILPLPTIKAGDLEETPFVLIIDQTGPHYQINPDEAEALRHNSGARVVWTTDGILDAPQAVTLNPEQREQLLTNLGI